MTGIGDEIRAARAAARQRLIDQRLASGTMRGTLRNSGWASRKPLPSSAAAVPFSGEGGGGGDAPWFKLHGWHSIDADTETMFDWKAGGAYMAESSPGLVQFLDDDKRVRPTIPGMYMVHAQASFNGGTEGIMSTGGTGPFGDNPLSSGAFRPGIPWEMSDILTMQFSFLARVGGVESPIGSPGVTMVWPTTGLGISATINDGGVNWELSLYVYRVSTLVQEHTIDLWACS